MNDPSDRILDQRLRNRIMEAVHTLAQGDDGVRRVWPTEYFESFYDWVIEALSEGFCFTNLGKAQRNDVST